MPGLALPGHQPERQFDEASDQQRNRDQQSDLAITQAKICPDQRKRGALRPVGQFVDELNRERNGNSCDANRAGAEAA